MEFWAHTFNIIFFLSPSQHLRLLQDLCSFSSSSPRPVHREGCSGALPATAHGAAPSIPRHRHLETVGDVPRHPHRALAATTGFQQWGGGGSWIRWSWISCKRCRRAEEEFITLGALGEPDIAEQRLMHCHVRRGTDG
jgi:hypothetical protein